MSTRLLRTRARAAPVASNTSERVAACTTRRTRARMRGMQRLHYSVFPCTTVRSTAAGRTRRAALRLPPRCLVSKSAFLALKTLASCVSAPQLSRIRFATGGIHRSLRCSVRLYAGTIREAAQRACEALRESAARQLRTPPVSSLHPLSHATLCLAASPV